MQAVRKMTGEKEIKFESDIHSFPPDHTLP